MQYVKRENNTGSPEESTRDHRAMHSGRGTRASESEMVKDRTNKDMEHMERWGSVVRKGDVVTRLRKGTREAMSDAKSSREHRARRARVFYGNRPRRICRAVRVVTGTSGP